MKFHWVVPRFIYFKWILDPHTLKRYCCLPQDVVHSRKGSLMMSKEHKLCWLYVEWGEDANMHPVSKFVAKQQKKGQATEISHISSI